MSEQILRLTDVSARVGIKRGLIYKLIKKGEFPKPLKLGGRASGWQASKIDDWIREQAAKQAG